MEKFIKIHSPFALPLRWLLLPAALAFTTPAPAAVTTVSHWRMGENDPGAFGGGSCPSTVDLVGGRTLQFAPNVFWETSSVSAIAAARVGSTTCLRAYGAESAGTNAAIPSLTNNFGLELWVNPLSLTGNQCLAYNGASSNSGWGLYLVGNQYRGLFGGVNFIGTATATASVWTHLALVRDNGTTTLYVNGVAAGTSGSGLVPPAGRFAVMGQPQAPTLERLNGMLDEVRVFTFTPGGFSTNDLLLNLGLVTTTADSGAGSLRQAITDANAVNVPANISFVVNGTITLASDLPAFTNRVNIIGPGTNLLTISGSNSFRLFQFAANTTNRIGGLTLANGRATNDNSGAAIYNLGNTVVTNCLFVSNTVVGGFGGALANFGTGSLAVTNCTFANNTVRGGNGDSGDGGGSGGGGGGLGGAIFTEGTGLTLSGCVFESNIAAGGNGGNANIGGGFAMFAGGNGGFPNRGFGGSHDNPGGAGGFGGGGGGGGLNGGGGGGGFGGGGGGSGALGQNGSGGSYGGAGGITTAGPVPPGGGGGGAGLGGAVFARTGAVAIVNCTFTSNLATNGVGGTGYQRGGNGQGVGGAVFSLVTPTITGSTFSGNAATTAAPNSFTPASFIVTSLADSGSGTLRNLIGFANTNADANEFFFLPSLSGQTITLTSGELVISNSLTITASNLPANVIISGGGTSRIFFITNNSTVMMSGLTLTGGNGAGAFDNGSGGAIDQPNGSLTMTRCTLSGNSATGASPAGWGGAIYCQGTLTLNECQLVNNTGRLAGAIFSKGAHLTLNLCAVSGNSSVADGGAIYNFESGTVILNGSTFSGNVANSGLGGGALLNDNSSSATLTQCTLSGNSAKSGGGGALRNLTSTLKVINCTISGNTNTAGNGGGIRNESISSTLFITNTVVSLNSGGDISGPITSSSSNLVGLANISLAPLGYYGGTAMTMPPLPGSPAIDAGADSVTNSFTTDQRGKARLLGAHVDIGAVEGVFDPNYPLVNVTKLGSGNVQFGFTNLSGPSYAILAGTNVALPFNTWSNLGAPTESPAGTFTFTDLQATNYPQRFYRVVKP